MIELLPCRRCGQKPRLIEGHWHDQQWQGERIICSSSVDNPRCNLTVGPVKFTYDAPVSQVWNELNA